VVVGLRQEGAHAQPFAVLGGLDVVELAGQRVGPGVAVQVDKAVQDSLDSGSGHRCSSCAVATGQGAMTLDRNTATIALLQITDLLYDKCDSLF
jgi:hypothetical protein